jgi:hypothetical protein
MMDDDFGAEDEEDDTPEILISISQSIALKRRVAKGEFASLDEAIAKSKEELQLTKVGEDWYSAEALERLEKGIRQAERGEVITSKKSKPSSRRGLKRLKPEHAQKSEIPCSTPSPISWKTGNGLPMNR